jgi:carbon monoxide dehydrogenase subunit G
MSTAYASTIIDAPLAKVWAHLRNFGAVAAYNSAAAKTSLEGAESGDQVGSVRSVSMPDGTVVRERLLALSDVDHSATYTVEIEGAPFRNALSSVRLLPVTDRGVTFIEWTAEFDAADLSVASHLREHLVNDIFADLFRGIRALVANE